ncbi:hypothetical protein [Nostoc sp.]|uniref:hypothetical protein n=1 Tax=Nostoc sp. TaxID=1180 RepID=UPI002FFD349F
MNPYTYLKNLCLIFILILPYGDDLSKAIALTHVIILIGHPIRILAIAQPL